MYDLIVIGGGTSGIAAAVSASQNNCKTLLIEKMGFLGGTATASLVTPMMRNILKSKENLTDGLYLEILKRLNKTKDAATHEDGNPGWFNPEMLKCVLDDICDENNIDILFETVITDVTVENDTISKVTCFNKSGFSTFKAKYFIDATGDADVAAMAGVPYRAGNSEILCNYKVDEESCNIHKNQAISLRFTMSNVNTAELGEWLLKIDPTSGISSVSKSSTGQMLLTTAHTWENKDWKLRPYFENAVKDGILKEEDGAYFQIFSIPGQPDSIAFNCPRIFFEKPVDTLNMWDLSYAQKMGRKQIRRIANFCTKYLKGFEKAYISQIAPSLGIRDSRRIEGRYTLTENDILGARKFDNFAAKSNYPVDIHATEKGKSELKFLPENDYYEIPVECLMPKKINNLLVAGRCISATFRAQASLRIQPNCWAIGEKAGQLVSEKLTRPKVLDDNMLLAALVPHPAVAIDDVGGAESLKLKKTSSAFKELANDITRLGPDLVIIITPHGPMTPHSFNVYTDEKLKANFSKFGAPNARLIYRNDLNFIKNIEDKMKFGKLKRVNEPISIDHGASVPLYFLYKAGYKGNVAVFNYSMLSAEDHLNFGNLLRETAKEMGKRVVFLASGELSHKLSNISPKGYNPVAHHFDEFIIDYINKGDYESILNIDEIYPRLRNTAGECAYNSILIALGFLNMTPNNNKTRSYETPFGIGYLIATL